MKKSTYKLGCLILTVGFCLISYSGNSQDIKLSKQDQKEEKRAEMIANFQILDTILESKSFVLRADYLENQYGRRIPVSSIVNFIRMDSTNVVLQTGSNSGLGPNGVGGVTAEGKLEHLKIFKNYKNLSYYLQFNIMTTIGIYDVAISVNADSYARATISGVTMGKLIYDGNLISLNNSNVYKGQTTYKFR